LSLDRHGDLILVHPVEIPGVMLGQGLDHIDRVKGLG
jgi:hypothetical protein